MSKSDLEEAASGKIQMGVGSGGGNLFVEGDYDSIKALQEKLFELEDTRREIRELKAKILDLVQK